MQPAVEVAHLKKAYGAVVAVEDISFAVPPQTVFGVVGPNGAGKTTTIECIEGLRTPDAGSVRVLGLDPARDHKRLYRRLGVQLQESSLYENIKLREALRLFAAMYKTPRPLDQLLHDFGLEDKANSYYRKLSGGQKRKFLTALALVGRPDLVLLDEPTSGLDPQSRLSFWTVLRRYRGEGLTVLLTTHDLQEAEENCDQVCIVDQGRVVALGTPAALLDEYRLGTRVAVPWSGNGLDRAALAQLPGYRRCELIEGRLYVFGDGDDFLGEVSRYFRAAGIEDLTSRRASLEDLYLIVTGRGYRQEGEASS